MLVQGDVLDKSINLQGMRVNGSFETCQVPKKRDEVDNMILKITEKHKLPDTR
jgi:hypothetical protein